MRLDEALSAIKYIEDLIADIINRASIHFQLRRIFEVCQKNELFF